MNFEVISEKVYNQPWLRITIHCLFWICSWLIYWNWDTNFTLNLYDFSPQSFIWFKLLGNLCIILFYYPLIYYVLPHFFKREKYVTGTIAILTLVLLYALLSTVAEIYFLRNCDQCMVFLKATNLAYYQHFYSGILNQVANKIVKYGILLNLVYFLATPLCIKFGLQAYRQQIAAAKLLKHNYQLEINFLKSQVNPHFLFNSLNNIYGLILQKKNAKAAEFVTKLSDFLRYGLYNSLSDKMPLDKEVTLLKNYIELESIRLNHTKINLDIVIDSYNYEFPSLLLLPVVENAFKYSPDVIDTYIRIVLHIKDGVLNFELDNSTDQHLQLKSEGGIGLANLKKRLELYYPNKYKYDALFEVDKYITHINIAL
ncbi:MAG: histidine kinase [Sphingobacteriaceae bacterium]|nr:MAG: histidine kinase [Sphingobacteriaceae bacterium]